MALLRCTKDDGDHLRHAIQTFGFGSLLNAIIPSVLTGLQSEANELAGSAVFAKQSDKVRYQARIAPLGPEAKALLFGRQMQELLFFVCGERVLPSEDRSCLTFYHEGDHLGPHLDHPAAECMVTAILYLAVSVSPVPPANTGLVLHVYGREMAADSKPRLTIPTTVGTLVVGRGAQFWHERPTLEKGEYAAALTGCYRLAS